MDPFCLPVSHELRTRMHRTLTGPSVSHCASEGQTSLEIGRGERGLGCTNDSVNERLICLMKMSVDHSHYMDHDHDEDAMIMIMMIIMTKIMMIMMILMMIMTKMMTVLILLIKIMILMIMMLI